MHVRIHLKGIWPRWVDMPLKQGNSFLNFVSQTRMEGFCCDERVYVPLDNIALMLPLDLGAFPEQKTTVN